MKRTVFYTLLGVLAALSCLFALFHPGSEFIAGVLSFPFAQVSDLLRWLSLSGTFGNLVSWLVYLLLGLFPLGLLYLRRPLTVKNAFMPILMSVVLLYVLYAGINPMAPALLLSAPGGLLVYRAELGGTVYITALTWLILRWLDQVVRARERGLYLSLLALLQLFAAGLVVVAFGSCTSQALSDIQAVQGGNGMQGLLPTYIMMVFGSLVQALPMVLNVITVISAMDLVEALRDKSPMAGFYAHRLSRWCTGALALSLCASVLYHVCQMVLIPWLVHSSTTVDLPVVSMVFVVLCMVVARLVEENMRLQDEQDLFI